MAKEITYKTVVDTSSSQKSVNELTDEMKKLEEARDKATDPKEIRNYNKELKKTEKRLSKTRDGMNRAGKAQKALNTGEKGLGVAMKAAGIGLIVGLFAKLVDVLSENQKVADAFSIVMDTVKGVFNEVMKAAEPLVDAFSAIIEMRWGDAADAFSEFGDRVSNLGKNLGQVTKDSYENAKAITNLKNEKK